MKLQLWLQTLKKRGISEKYCLKNSKSDSKCNFKITLVPFLCAEVVNVFGRAAELLSGNAQDNSLVQINFHLGPSLYYVSKETWWVGSEKLQFLLTFSTIYADEGWMAWVGQKKSKNVLM